MANTWAVRDVWVLKCPFLADSFVNSFVGRVSLQFRKIRRFHVNCDDVFVFHFPQTLFSFYLLTICPVLLRKDFKSWNGNILVLSCVFHISFVELVNTYDIQNTGRKFTLKKNVHQTVATCSSDILSECCFVLKIRSTFLINSLGIACFGISHVLPRSKINEKQSGWRRNV